MRPVQSGSSARAKCPQWLMPMQLTCKVSRCTGMDGSECNGPAELEADTLADRQPMQLTPYVSGNGTTWSLSYHTGK